MIPSFDSLSSLCYRTVSDNMSGWAWQRQDDMVTLSATMATYAEAVGKFNECAAALFEHVRLQQLRQKEIEAESLRKEVAALRLVIPLLLEEMNTDACREECGSGDADAIPCGKDALHRGTTQMELDIFWATL